MLLIYLEPLSNIWSSHVIMSYEKITTNKTSLFSSMRTFTGPLGENKRHEMETRYSVQPFKKCSTFLIVKAWLGLKDFYLSTYTTFLLWTMPKAILGSSKWWKWAIRHIGVSRVSALGKHLYPQFILFSCNLKKKTKEENK